MFQIVFKLLFFSSDCDLCFKQQKTGCWFMLKFLILQYLCNPSFGISKNMNQLKFMIKSRKFWHLVIWLSYMQACSKVWLFEIIYSVFEKFLWWYCNFNEFLPLILTLWYIWVGLNADTWQTYSPEKRS